MSIEMTTQSKETHWIGLIVLLTVLSFIVLLNLIYLLEPHLGIADLVARKVYVVGPIVCTFAFTLMGFLAAMITIFFSFADSPFFRRYKKNGHFKDFLSFYYVAILSLFVTFFVGLGAVVHSTLTAPLLAAVVVNAFQFVVICLIMWRHSLKV